jgi:hypothetical protein
VKAKTGKSIPSISVTRVRIGDLLQPSDALPRVAQALRHEHTRLLD